MIDITSVVDNFNLAPQIPTLVPPTPKKSSKWLIIALLLILLGAGLIWYFNAQSEPKKS